jgi:hypothetical protein
MKHLVVFAVIGLAGCSWFHHKPPRNPPSEYIVTGAPAGAVILMDSAPQGEAVVKGRAQVFVAPPGYHLLEVRVGDGIAYREQTYLSLGEHQVVHVLSPG